MHGAFKSVSPPSDLIITRELQTRPQKKTDYRREKLAVEDLASRMIDRPQDILPRFVELAQDMTGAVSSGLSLYEDTPAPGVFRWKHLHGSLARFEGATTPRHFSPCGVTLDQNAPLLIRNPEQYYDWVAQTNMQLPEVLLVPLHLKGGDVPIGTLWMVSDTYGHFDGGDARALSELASFVGTALRILRTEERLQAALAEQELLAAELEHRVKNLFSLTENMIRMSRAGASTADELAEALTGRLRALVGAHGLVRRSFAGGQDTPPRSDLAELLRAIVLPHDSTVAGGAPRFRMRGARIGCGDRAATGLALAFHELATNAVKYGALRNDIGHVGIDWRLADERLRLRWQERGGPRIETPPAASGFGSRLMKITVTRQLGGTLHHDWRAQGLAVTMEIPVASLSA